MSTTSADLPTETLGVVAHGAGDLRVESVPLRRPAASEAVVEIAYGGVCGSDLHYWTHGAAATTSRTCGSSMVASSRHPPR